MEDLRASSSTSSQGAKDASFSGEDMDASDMDTIALPENSNIKGNITSKNVLIAGKLEGDIDADKVHIKKTADVEGEIKQRTLSIEEGSVLKIKTEVKK